ncbi:glutamyl aminopeptidase [Alkalibacterium pelagium]|jgi:glutamyl aminopeptidase|uniref:Glutamyl aminopeptidase n=1 Tax=Alkalibacterium pelagium TaxID=426702 RepID=A0A1H7NCU5_9LACT|nr:glutamyl aminopeptidase [Alkalibacterium pelagium]GEN51369.1 glutamyl aminopeptidase [Alkalibacterium pelagium]SEL21330.1 glutamyl aminopeptidase [Alkalibacterium pelagium]
MNEETFQMIKRTTELQGISGFEHNVRDFMRDEMNGLVDRIETDGLGGLFGVKESQTPDAPKLMLAAHMDEVGFMVSSITSKGLIKVLPIGGWNPYVVSSQRFTIQTKKGEYPLVSSSIPPHLLKDKKNTSISIDSILFDGGFESKEEAEEYGVRPGDPIVPVVETIQMANKKTFAGKAWDNRYGVTLVLELLKQLKEEQLPSTLIAGANVQEEVGLRGTKGSVRKFQPDAFLAVDCSPANDLNGDKEAFGRLGDGFLLRIQDPGMILSREMKDYLIDTAETNKIPYQYFVSKGGTDAVAAHTLNEGIPSAVIGVPARYIHTHQSLFRIDDYEAAREMVYQIVKTFDRSVLETLKTF